MPRPTSQEIQNEIEAKLAEMPEDERNATIAMDKAQTRLTCIQLSRATGHTIEPIENDMHHVKVDGEALGYVEFADWIIEHAPAIAAQMGLRPESNENSSAEDNDEADA